MELSFTSGCWMQGASRSALFLLFLVTTLSELLSLFSQQSVISRLLASAPTTRSTTRSTTSINVTLDEQRQKVLNVHDESIRSWGCHVTAAPFVFVHIGKAGGGVVRRRLATAALNFTRQPEHWYNPELDDHYYPVLRRNYNDTTTIFHKAKLCNSARNRHLPVSTSEALFFEGSNRRCTAMSPIGHILACPEIFSKYCHPQDPSDPNSAHFVYMGHNYLGTELHWLPIPYLRDWWKQHYWRSTVSDDEHEDNDSSSSLFLEKLATLDGIQPWCQDYARPLTFNDYHPERFTKYYDCAQQHLEPDADALDGETLQRRFFSDFAAPPTDQQKGRAWGEIYASLPVVRVTVLREPFSWLRSKFAWHHLGRKFNWTCDDVATASQLDGYWDLHVTTRPGWARLMPLQYIFFLCGEDCHARMQAGKATLEQIEAQAAYNLRNSFAVVGLLQEQETFFEMIHARVDYMDMHLNYTTNMTDDGSHQSRKDQHCAERFSNSQFQQELLEASPELAALKRLYEIGVQVNRFQMRELEQCSGMNLVPKLKRL